MSADKKLKRITIALSEGVSIQELNPAVGLLEGSIVRTFRHFPYIVMELPEERVEDLGTQDFCKNYFEDQKVYALEQKLPWGVARIEAEQVQAKYGIKGYGVKVAVLDTGIDLNHPDIKVAGGTSVISPSYQDDNGHGTHVAGIIAALDNGEGVIGVAPEAQLYAVKVLNASGSGSWSDVAAGLEWCLDNDIDIISMSLGGSSGDPLVQAAVTKVHEHGIIMIAAAGNSGTGDGAGDTVIYPAKYPEVIAVAATDSSDKRAVFSSTGPDIEISAPGVNILSTYLGSAYKTLNGTSMATPHVSGLAALIKSVYPELSNVEIRKKLSDTAIDLGDTGKDPWYGFGLISAPAAVQLEGPDTSPPQVFFRNLENNQVVSGALTIEILVQDPSGVSGISLSIDENPVGEWKAPPYVYFWDCTKVSAGAHTLQVDAVDAVGNKGQTRLQLIVGATVNLFEPGEGFVVRDMVPVKASFSHNVVVTQAKLFVDGILKETKDTVINNNVEFNWDSTEITAPGVSTHVIKVAAVTENGIQTSDTVNVLMRNPVVKVILPDNNWTVQSDFQDVAVHATDGSGIEKVEFLLDNKILDTVYTQPYITRIDFTGLPVGNHLIKGVAYSKNGHAAESQEVIVRKPTVISILSPLSNQIIKGSTTVTAKFADPVSKAELFVGNTSRGAISVNGLGPVSWTISAGSYPDLSIINLRVNAYTQTDNVLSTGQVSVTVENYQDITGPLVKIRSPQSGEIVRDRVEITVEAVDDNGISYVEIYLDDTALNKFTAPPYTVTHDFSQVPAGKHYLSAKASDIFGNVTASEKVEILKPVTFSIVYPTDKQIVTGVISEFKINCADQIAGEVKLFIDEALCQTMQLEAPTSGPITIPYVWDTTRYGDFSQHSIMVEVRSATDSIPSQATVVLTVDNSFDEVPPSVVLKSSHEGIVSGTVRFTAEATDNKGIERIEFYINGVLAEDQVFPNEYEWDSMKVPSGKYSFTAKAYDLAGNSGVSNIVNVAVPTSVTIAAPAPGSHLVGPVTGFTANFAEPVVGNVSLYIDGEYKAGAVVDTPTTGPVKISYIWDTSGYPGLSEHQITIVGYTYKGNVESAGNSRVFVDNSVDTVPPVVTLSASTHKLLAGEPLTLSATVTDNEGIFKVEIYEYDTLVATLTEGLYQYQWPSSDKAVGKYTFYAKAYDFAGNITASNQISVGVATTVRIDDPADGQVVSGVVSRFSVYFNDPVKGYVYLFIDGVLVAGQPVTVPVNQAAVNYAWDTTAYGNGSIHEIKIRSYTDQGSVRSEGVSRVLVQNQ